jgi:hypothetical protein
MFGHQDQDPQNTSNSNATAVASAATAPAYTDPIQQLNDSAGLTPTLSSDPSTDVAEPAPPTNALSPAGGYPQATTEKIRKGGDEELPEEITAQPSFSAEPTPPPPPADAVDDLNAIKQQVISELFPLIDELDQTPDERFKTLMMMIQATDNQTLLRSAFEAAHSIADTKQKAQALLDIINEINYFTHTDKPAES